MARRRSGIAPVLGPHWACIRAKARAKALLLLSRRRTSLQHEALGAHERAGQQLLHGVVPTQQQVAQVVTVQLVPAAIGQEQRALLRLVVPASWGPLGICRAQGWYGRPVLMARGVPKLPRHDLAQKSVYRVPPKGQLAGASASLFSTRAHTLQLLAMPRARARAVAPPQSGHCSSCQP